GLLRQMRDQMAAAQEQRTPRNDTVVDASPSNSSNSSSDPRRANGQAFAVTPAERAGNGAGTPRERRPRPARTGPMLVKPAQDGVGRERNELPERAIARDATDRSSRDRVELPEVALRRDAAGTSGATNGAGSDTAHGNGTGNGSARRIAP